MKKTLFLLISLVICFSVNDSVKAEGVNVIIPQYEVKINEAFIDYQKSLYPLISYKDITYFPMTYEYCRFMNLTTSWVEGEGLWIAYKPRYVEEVPSYENTTSNKKKNTAQLPDYPIYINGEKIDNINEEYPILNFRDVTYFPMTWDYAHEEFCWETNWKDGLFEINTNASDRVYMDVIEKNNGYAIIKKGYPYNVELENGYWTTLVGNKYYKLNFQDDSLREIEYEEQNEVNNQNPRELDAKIENGKIICEGQEFNAIDYIASGKGDESGFWMNSYCQMFGDVEIYNFAVYYNTGAPIVYNANEAYQYIKTQNGFVRLSENMEDEYLIKSAAKLGEDIYICANKRNWKSVLWNSELFCIRPDGTVTRVNDLMKDHNSVNLIGEFDGKLFLENLWSPENFNDVYAPGVQEVSAYNDGLFMYDGKTLAKIAPFVHEREALLSPNGKIYSLTKWKDEIKRVH